MNLFEFCQFLEPLVKKDEIRRREEVGPDAPLPPENTLLESIGLDGESFPIPLGLGDKPCGLAFVIIDLEKPMSEILNLAKSVIENGDVPVVYAPSPIVFDDPDIEESIEEVFTGDLPDHSERSGLTLLVDVDSTPDSDVSDDEKPLIDEELPDGDSNTVTIQDGDSDEEFGNSDPLEGLEIETVSETGDTEINDDESQI